jgi:hypothetical protein
MYNHSSTVKFHLELLYWMALFRRVLVLPPHLDSLIALST